MDTDAEQRAPLADCQNCPLNSVHNPSRGRISPCVPGAGPALADVVIVGEAPGGTEVTLGEPFIGESGQLLDDLLDGAGLRREDVYVTNAVLCASRDKGRNVPVPQAAVKACQARLLEEIRRRQPKVVVALGGVALKALGAGEKITGERGRERWVTAEQLKETLHRGRRKRDLDRFPLDERWRDGGAYVLPTFHPAFALRNPDAYPDLAKDLGRAAELLEQEPGVKREVPAVKYEVAGYMELALGWIAHLERQSVIACDIEATSKDPLKDRLLTLAYAWRQDGDIHAVVIPAEIAAHPRVRAALARLHSGPVRQVWWNGKFDRKWYRVHLDVDVRLDGDGMLAHYALDERRGIHGLKGRASDDLGADDYELNVKRYVGKGSDVDYGRIPFDELCLYTAQDVGMTLMLVEEYEARLAAAPSLDWVYRKILLPTAHVLGDMELTGCAVDLAALEALRADFETTLAGYVQTMRATSGVPELNPQSTPQLVQVLYGAAVRERYGIEAQTAEGLPSFNLPVQLNEDKRPGTGSEQCDKLLNLDPPIEGAARAFVDALQKHRLDGQLFKTYVNKLPKAVDADGRVRTNYNLHTTRTGRLSSSDPVNLQNIPVRREPGRLIKDAFVAAPGWLLLEADLSQAELRMAAFLSRDPALMRIYTEGYGGGDFHRGVGIKLLGSEEKAEALRPYVKTFNFAMLYDARPPKLTVLLNDAALEEEARSKTPQPRWTLPQVEKLYAEFWREFPTFAAWATKQRRAALGHPGYVETHFGRRRRFHLVTPALRRDVMKEAVNMPVQGTASDLILLGLVELAPQLDPAAARIVNSVHDSILLEVRPAAADATGRLVLDVLEGVPARHGIDVPVKADLKLGERWGSLAKFAPAV